MKRTLSTSTLRQTTGITKCKQHSSQVNLQMMGGASMNYIGCR